MLFRYRYGEGKAWTQGRVKQFFSQEELLIGKDFWDFICKSDKGYDIVIDELNKYAYFLWDIRENLKLKKMVA